MSENDVKKEETIPDDYTPSPEEVKALQITAQIISDLIMAARIPVNQITIGALGMVIDSYGKAVIEQLEKMKSAQTLYTAHSVNEAVKTGGKKIILAGNEK